MEAFQYLFISASLILAGVSLLLKHFFNDADYYRSFCAELRAKYILTAVDPKNWTMC